MELSIKYGDNVCENCKKQDGKYQHCEGDGRLHGHGMVHTIDGGLMWLCDDCAALLAKDWQDCRARIAQNKEKAARTA